MCVRGYLSNHHTCLIGIALRDFCPVTMMERNNNPMLLSNWLRDTRNPNKRNVLRWRVCNALYYTRPMLAAHNWGRERSSSSDRSRCFDDNGPKATRVPLSCLSALYDLLAPPRRCAALHYCVCVAGSAPPRRTSFVLEPNSDTYGTELCPRRERRGP